MALSRDLLGVSGPSGVSRSISPSILRSPIRAQGMIAGALLAACILLTRTAVAETYYPPPESKGGWQTLVTKNTAPTAAQKSAVLNAAGLDTDRLVAAWNYVQSLGQRQSLLVIRHGWIVGEWDYVGTGPVNSCTKSLTGLALAKLFELSDAGRISKKIGYDDFAYHYLPATWGDSDPRKKLIKVRDLPTMCSGLEAMDRGIKSLDMAMSLPVVHSPETIDQYSSASVMLEGMVIENASGQSLKSFFRRHLSEPIGAESVRLWDAYGAAGYAFMQTRDLARFGYLMLHNGAWDSGSGLQQLVRPDLIAKCKQWPPFLMNVADGPGNVTRWLTSGDPPSHLLHTWHGWWVNWSPDWPASQPAVWPFVPKDAFWMSGYGKDICVVIPSLDMIIAHQTARAGSLEQALSDCPEFFSTLLSKVMAAVVTTSANPSGDAAAARAGSVMDYGAKGDGVTDDTQAVQTAIDTCSAKGEKLVFPAGTYMTGTIYLRSNTAIELTATAVWKGIGRVEAYPMQRPRGFDGRMVNAWRAMIYAEDVENVSISGQGMIHGNGESATFPKIPNSSERPFGIWIVRGRDIRVEGIQLRSSAFWMEHYEECDHVRITGIRVFNHANLNNDGLDLTDCHDVSVSDVEIDSSDDALCLKSHGQRGVSDTVISNCVLASHAGAFKLGTASVGGFRHIAVNNLVIRPSAADHIEHPAKVKGGLAGLDLLSTDGGALEDLLIQNVVMDGVETPLVMKLGDRWAKAAKDDPPRAAGVIRNVFIGQMVARRSGPIPSTITGYPGHNVEDITLSNMLIEIEGGLSAQEVTVPENSRNYPYNRIFGQKLPAYVFFVRHARNMQFRDVQVKTIKPDERRAFVFEDATGMLDNVSIVNPGGPGIPPILVDKAEAIGLHDSNLKIEVRSQ